MFCTGGVNKPKPATCWPQVPVNQSRRFPRRACVAEQEKEAILTYSLSTLLFCRQDARYLRLTLHGAGFSRICHACVHLCTLPASLERQFKRQRGGIPRRGRGFARKPEERHGLRADTFFRDLPLTSPHARASGGAPLLAFFSAFGRLARPRAGPRQMENITEVLGNRTPTCSAAAQCATSGPFAVPLELQEDLFNAINDTVRCSRTSLSRTSSLRHPPRLPREPDARWKA